MMSKEAMNLALEALQEVYWSSRSAKHDEAITALREALAEQPARPYRLLQDSGSKYFGESWDKAEQPAQQALDKMAENARELGIQMQPAQDDPCPGCRKGVVCRTPKCGRLKLPVDHPYRSEQPAQQEPVAVHQFRKRGCSDWYDGHPDHTDGGGLYEARTLYTSPPAQRKPLTDEEIEAAFFATKTEVDNGVGNFRDGVRFAEAALQIGVEK